MSFAILLVHGYTGSPHTLKPLFDSLHAEYRNVKTICLPGHDNLHSDTTPSFNEKKFLDTISSEIEPLEKSGKQIILIGHSTGGSLILRYLQEKSLHPAAIILISTPKRITSDYIKRWETHNPGKDIPFIDMARMVSSINKADRTCQKFDFPILFVNGEDDQLVTGNETSLWTDKQISDHNRAVIIPSADHNIFFSHQSPLTIDVIGRFLSDIKNSTEEAGDAEKKQLLIEAEPLVDKLLSKSPHTLRHLINCPSGQHLFHNKSVFRPTALTEPVIANIEVTTFCDLKCRFCARTRLKYKNKHMRMDTFRRILDLLPHVFHLTLVGLGEPLLHPNIVEIVTEASSRNKKVSLVTNAMNLSTALSSDLVKSGLNSIVFSIDAATQNLASEIRFGSNLEKIKANIARFIETAKSGGQKISTAVFSGVSFETLPYAGELIDLVSQLDINALMLTDLNFKENIEKTLWKNKNKKTLTLIRQAVRHAFSKKLPVLSVKGLEEFGLAERYKNFLLLPPEQLCQRSASHTNCFSPWQTIAVGVDGDITLCDCQPEKKIGNLLDSPLTNLWNGDEMMRHRSQMISNHPPEACRICPRF